MGLRCIFGHDAVDEVFQGGTLLGRCPRCAKQTIRRRGGRVYVIPRKVIGRMNATGPEAISKRRALHLARKRGFFSFRLPRRQSAWDAYYD